MKKLIIVLVVVAAAVGLGVYFYLDYRHAQELKHPDFYSGNGRLEATEIYVCTKLAGRVEKVFVKEGDLVRRGDKLVQMQDSTLRAQRAATIGKIKVAEGELAMAKATLKGKESAYEGAKKELDRQQKMRKGGASTERYLENAMTAFRDAEAALDYAKGQIIAAEGKIAEQKAELLRIEEDIKDSLLIATYDGRIQYLLAHDGEVLSAGGRVMNLVNLTDAYMTFFLPTQIVGQVKMGADVRLIFDADTDYAFLAKITFVDPVAQFTPKSVETKVEREKMMFRVKAHLNAEQLRKYVKDVKTGLPGIACVRVNPQADWSTSPVRDAKPVVDEAEAPAPKKTDAKAPAKTGAARK